METKWGSIKATDGCQRQALTDLGFEVVGRRYLMAEGKYEFFVKLVSDKNLVEIRAWLDSMHMEHAIYNRPSNAWNIKVTDMSKGQLEAEQVYLLAMLHSEEMKKQTFSNLGNWHDRFDAVNQALAAQ